MILHVYFWSDSSNFIHWNFSCPPITSAIQKKYFCWSKNCCFLTVYPDYSIPPNVTTTKRELKEKKKKNSIHNKCIDNYLGDCYIFGSDQFCFFDSTEKIEFFCQNIKIKNVNSHGSDILQDWLRGNESCLSFILWVFYLEFRYILSSDRPDSFL